MLMKTFLSARTFRLVAMAAAALTLASCGGDDSGAGGGGTAADVGSPVQGDWVVIQTNADAENLNYLVGTDATGQELNNYMLESLTITDYQTLQQVPWIADSLAKISDDHMTYEYRLKPNVVFSDGTPVTGEDFIFTLKAIKNPYIPNAPILAGYYADIDRVELVDGDPHRIRFTMSKPYFLAEQITGGLVALPKHIWDPTGLSDKYTFEELNKNDPNKNPAMKQFADFFADITRAFDPKFEVGSGPYMLESFSRNDKTVLARNPHYWNKDSKWGKQYPDKVIYRTIQDPNAAVTALKGGEVDFVPIMQKVSYVNEKSRFESNRLKGAEYDYPGYNYVGYNGHSVIFRDKMVRQAMARAIDRDAIIKNIYYDMARPVQSPVFYNRPEYDTTLPLIKFDLDKAKQMLADAGWTDSDGNGVLDKVVDGQKVEFRFKMMIPSQSLTAQPIALIMGDALKKIGIEMTTNSLDWATFLKRSREGDFDAYIAGWGMDVTEGDPFQLWHSESIHGGSNYIYFKNDRIDQIIMEMRNEFDRTKRMALWKEFQQIINEEQPYNFLVAQLQTGAYHDRFQNVAFYAPRPCYLPGTWWVPLTAQKYTSQKAVAAN